MLENPHLSVIKLAFNSLGDEGAAIIASGFVVGGGGHHKNLSVLDLGFNGIGDVGCAAIALHAVAGNRSLGVLYLSGNNIGERGAISLAGAMLHGCSLTSLHISANHLGAVGIQALARAVAENEACRNTHTSCTVGDVTPVHCDQKSMEELYLGDTSMTANGFIPIPSMLLTNISLRILCLSNNGIDDNSMSLLSQALSRNKNVPLESVQLSFNKITCAGLECFMNAIWGSKTLRELKVDNNRIQDRGAQLAAVVLGAIDLEVLDLGFNRITNVGIKALMKSLSESSSLQTLGISGIPLDATACKAVSYGLAYNSSLQVFRVDNCQVGYSGQRHIVAGIVSNRQASLRSLTGFDLGRKCWSFQEVEFTALLLTCALFSPVFLQQSRLRCSFRRISKHGQMRNCFALSASCGKNGINSSVVLDVFVRSRKRRLKRVMLPNWVLRKRMRKSELDRQIHALSLRQQPGLWLLSEKIWTHGSTRNRMNGEFRKRRPWYLRMLQCWSALCRGRYVCHRSSNPIAD
jgi:Ran GTPase-activating protein (RanGAP) involved in mRNA processing and transport